MYGVKNKMAKCGKCTQNRHYTCLDDKQCQCGCHHFFFCRFGVKHEHGTECECIDYDKPKKIDPKAEKKFENLMGSWRALKRAEHVEHNKRMLQLKQNGVKDEDMFFYRDSEGNIIE